MRGEEELMPAIDEPIRAAELGPNDGAMADLWWKCSRLTADANEVSVDESDMSRLAKFERSIEVEWAEPGVVWLTKPAAWWWTVDWFLNSLFFFNSS